MENEVAAENIDAVINGFKNFLKHSIETNNFDVIEMKNFMEPIFSRAGYRDRRSNGGGRRSSERF